LQQSITLGYTSCSEHIRAVLGLNRTEQCSVRLFLTYCVRRLGTTNPWPPRKVYNVIAEVKEPYQRGLYFDEFEIGQEIQSVGRTVTEADVVGFAAVTGDWTRIHTDAVYASQHPLGQRVAHGLLGLSIAVSLATRTGFIEGTVLAFREIEDWKFRLPIYLGDTISMRATVTDTKLVRQLGGGLVYFKVDLLNQELAVVQQGKWTLMVMNRPEG